MGKIILLLLSFCAVQARAEEYVSAVSGREAYYAVYNQAVTAHMASRLGEACRLYAKAAEEAGKLEGAGWEFGRAMSLMAVAYHARGMHAQAEKYYLLSMDYYRKSKMRELSVAVSGLGRLYLEQGNAQKAGPLLKEAAELAEADERENKYSAPYALADAFSALAQLYERLGNKKKAETFYLAAVGLFGEAQTSFAFQVLDAEQMDSYPIILYRTGLFYVRAGKAERGAAFYARALKAFENWRNFDGRPALKARVLDYRGRTLKALGRAAEGDADAREAARLYEAVRAAD